MFELFETEHEVVPHVLLVCHGNTTWYLRLVSRQGTKHLGLVSSLCPSLPIDTTKRNASQMKKERSSDDARAMFPSSELEQGRERLLRCPI
jgi:hypothetical protein